VREGEMRVRKGKGYNCACAANAMPSPNRTLLSAVRISFIFLVFAAVS